MINGVKMPKQASNNGPVYAVALIICVLIVTLGVVFGMSRTSTTQPQGGALSSIAVSASGTAKGIPSMAQVDLYINATGNTTAAATANLSSKLIAFNKTVYPYVNGNMSLVKTNYYNVGKPPIYYYPSSNTTSNVPYQAQVQVSVTLPQISKLNGFLFNITNVTGLQVQDVSATLSDAQVSQLRQQALQSALTNATNQATSVIGNVAIVNTTISVGSYYAVPFPIYASANGGSVSPAKAGSLYYNGTTSVFESIQATFYYRK
jgi:uncharacterized protein YggE